MTEEAQLIQWLFFKIYFRLVDFWIICILFALFLIAVLPRVGQEVFLLLCWCWLSVVNFNRLFSGTVESISVLCLFRQSVAPYWIHRNNSSCFKTRWWRILMSPYRLDSHKCYTPFILGKRKGIPFSINRWCEQNSLVRRPTLFYFISFQFFKIQLLPKKKKN